MKITRFAILLIISVLLTSCAGELTDTRPRIAVSIEPLRYFTEQIAGDHYKVTTLMPTGGSPETYEPTPHQIVELSQRVRWGSNKLNWRKWQRLLLS